MPPKKAITTAAPALPDAAVEMAQTMTAAVEAANAAQIIAKERDQALARVTALEAEVMTLRGQLARQKKELTLTEEDESKLREMLADISFDRKKRGAHDFYVDLKGGQVGFKHLSYRGPTLMDVIMQMRRGR